MRQTRSVVPGNKKQQHMNIDLYILVNNEKKPRLHYVHYAVLWKTNIDNNM